MSSAENSGQVTVCDEYAASSPALTRYDRTGRRRIRCTVGGCRPDRNETWIRTLLGRSYHSAACSAARRWFEIYSEASSANSSIASQRASPCCFLLKQDGPSARGSDQPASERKPWRQTLPNSNLRNLLFSAHAGSNLLILSSQDRKGHTTLKLIRGSDMISSLGGVRQVSQDECLFLYAVMS